MWLALIMFTAIAVCIYVVRHRLWFLGKRVIGVGFWLTTMVFYVSSLFATAAGFAPYFVGDRSSIQWAGILLGFIFLVLGFPRLPLNSVADDRPKLPTAPCIG